jgi:hypothetical protein
VAYGGLIRAQLVDGFDVELGQSAFGGVVLGGLLTSQGKRQSDHGADARADGQPRADGVEAFLPGSRSQHLDQHRHPNRRANQHRHDDHQDRPPPTCSATWSAHREIIA